MPLGDARYELVEGLLVAMSPVSLTHGRITARVAALLDAHAESRGLGVVGVEVGFVLSRDPDTVRAPDVAFIMADHVRSANAHGFFHGPPDLAVEVLSPEDRRTEMATKIGEYLRCGTAAVLVVDPAEQTASIHRRLSPVVVASAKDDEINLDDVIPDLRVRVRDILR